MEHHIFKRTFLDKAEAQLCFHPVVPVSEHASSLNQFIRQEFHTDIEFPVPQEACTITLDQKNGGIHLSLGNGNATAEVRRGHYVSFEATLLPRLEFLCRYADNVEGIYKVDELIISKSNVWQINCESPREEMNCALSFTFRDGMVDDILRTALPGENIATFTIGKETTSAVEELGKLDTSLDVEVSSSAKSLTFRLNFKASAKDILLNDVAYTAVKLNQAIFDAFVGMVSDDVLNLMNRNS